MLKNLQNFYNDATVLVTGGTGFMGKVLVEKLVRCLNVKTVILLVRSKNDKTAEQRLVEYMQETIFDRLHKERPKALQNALKVISVDYNVDNLCIAPRDLATIVSTVQIVFNMVASVKFNDKLKDAINVNILATKRVLTLVKQITTLKAFVHVSTFYSQYYREHIGENVLQGQINCEKLLSMNECLDTADLELLKTSILQTMPNTYTFTKRLVEELVEADLKMVPRAIFRPPILLSTYEEPFPGWIDNLYGPMAFGIGVTRGLIHCAYSDNNKQANIMPVDFCINALVAVAWDANRKRRSADTLVYNYLYENPTWGDHLGMLKHGMHEPLDRPIWHGSCYTFRSWWLYKLFFFILHMIPGYLMDMLATVRGQKPQFVKGYQKLNRMVSHVGFFALRKFSYDNQNLVALSRELKANGGCGGFEFDGAKIDWVKYYTSYVPGIKKYYLKESFANMEQLRRRYQRLKVLHYTLKYTVLVGLVLILIKLITGLMS